MTSEEEAWTKGISRYIILRYIRLSIADTRIKDYIDNTLAS